MSFFPSRGNARTMIRGGTKVGELIRGGSVVGHNQQGSLQMHVRSILQKEDQ